MPESDEVHEAKFDFDKWQANAPGGWWAKKKGCTCERLANFYGLGVWDEELQEVTHYVTPNCPVHDKQ